MKRRAVTVPVQSWGQLAFMDCITISSFCSDLYHPFWPLNFFATILTVWNMYSLVRLMWGNGEPITLAVGRKPVVEIAPPAPRTPVAFPPEPNQCFVCGTYDEHRQDVFGDASHAVCREWLGDWPIPNWVIYCRDYRSSSYFADAHQTRGSGYYKTNLSHLPGTTPRQHVIDYCHNDPVLIRYLNRDLYAELETPDGRAIKLDIPQTLNNKENQ